MKAVVADRQRLILICEYMYDKIGVRFNPSEVQGFAVISDVGDFVAAVIVSNLRFTDSKAIDCEISCAAETSIAWKPEVCRAIFGYIFGQLQCVRCTSIVRKNNTKSRAFLEALNFQLEGKLRKAYDGEKDALVYGLLAEECQFYGDLNG
jgi:hypothetical protein